MISNVLLIISFFWTQSSISPNLDTATLVDKTIYELEQVERLQFSLYMKERMNGEILESRSTTRLRFNPHSVYVKTIYPNDGVELLWNKEVDQDDVLVNPNGFPYINFTFSLFSDRLRKRNHHTLEESGFHSLLRLLKYAVEQADSFDQYFQYEGLRDWQGRTCHVLELDLVDYNITTYTAEKEEKLWDLAQRLLVGEYKIIELNKFDGFDTIIKKGQTIKVPTAYAKKATLYIDTITYMPIVQTIYDEIGLYEYYEFNNLKVNPTFANNEFTKDCKDYGF